MTPELETIHNCDVTNENSDEIEENDSESVIEAVEITESFLENTNE